MTAPAPWPADPTADQQHAAVRDWLWQHTAQPNGEPWDGNPELLAETAAALGGLLGPAVVSWREISVRGGVTR